MVDRAPGTARRQQAAADSRGAGLGPKGRGLFERLFSGLRTGSQEPRKEACTIAVASGKGGTGKSFLATSLAVVLHQAGRRVTLVDCDFGLACDHLLMGVKPRQTLQQLLAGKATLGEVRVATPCGPFLVPGASGVRKMADLTDKELMVLGRELGAMARQEEVLLLDIGAGIAPQTVLTMLCANHIVLVTQPEIAALVDAYAVVKCIAQLDDQAKFSVVVNRVLEPGRGEQAFKKLTEVARQHVGLSLEYLGEIPEDPRVSQHRLGQLPLVAMEPECEMANALRGIATRLSEVDGPLEPRTVTPDRGLEARFREHRLFL